MKTGGATTRGVGAVVDRASRRPMLRNVPDTASFSLTSPKSG